MRRPVLITGDIFRLQQQGGVSQYVIELVSRLADRCRVITGFHASPLVERIGRYVRNDVHVPKVPGVRRLFEPLNAIVDATAFAAVGPRAIVHAPYYRPAGSLPRGRPLTMMLHDFTNERFPGLALSKPEEWKHALCRKVDLVFCNSETTKRDAIEFVGLPPGKLRVAHSASRDWSGVVPSAIAGQDRPFVLWVAARHPYKNFPRALEAWATAKSAGDTDLLCIGGAPFGPGEGAEFVRLGVGDRVKHLCASDQEVRWAYENAIGLLFPSLWEGFGLPVVEAMTLGCPVVASTCPALVEVGGDPGLYAEAESIDAIRTALDTMIERGRTPDVVAALKHQAAQFSWDDNARTHVEAFDEFD